MYIITQYAKVLKRRTRILTKKYRLYAAFSVFLPLQLSNFRLHAVYSAFQKNNIVKLLVLVRILLNANGSDIIPSLTVEKE